MTSVSSLGEETSKAFTLKSPKCSLLPC
jgi:hypothetical protein